MYNKCLLIAILFVCTSCELLTDKPLEILYTGEDKLNMVLFLNNIPSSVVEYYLLIVNSSNSVIKQEHGNIKSYDARKRIVLDHVIETDQNCSVDLWKADRSRYILRDVFHLINDYSGREKQKHKCLNQKQACHIQIDFQFGNTNDSNPVIATVVNPKRYKNLNLMGPKNETVYFHENEEFDLKCYQNRVLDTYNLTWHQVFPLKNGFLDTEQLSRNTSFQLHIKLRWFDDRSTMFCAGESNEKSARITFKLIETQPETEETKKVYFNEHNTLTINCEKDKKLLKRKANGDFTLYGNNPAEIHDKSDNGSLFFCMRYKKIDFNKIGQSIFQASRMIHGEKIYIYNANLKTDSENVAIWVTGVIVAAVVVAGGIVLLRYKCCRLKNRPIRSQEHIYETPIEVVYAEINALPSSSDKPNPTCDEAPYVEIIGVLGPKNLRTNAASVSTKN